MILTYKIKHNKDFSSMLAKAKQVADFAVLTKTRSSKDVKQFGLPSTISNQILKKYSSNKKIKRVSRVNLIIPNQGIKYKDEIIKVSCIKLELNFKKKFNKINQIELNKEYAFVSVTVDDGTIFKPTGVLGIDLNATGHVAVMSNPGSGKIWKLCKKAGHVHKKYKDIRRNLQKKGLYKAVKKIKNRESRIVKDLNHKISAKIIKEAKKQQTEIVMEELKGIRKNKKHSKSFNGTLNSWSFYQLKQFIEYKAKLHGVTVTSIDPRYTSQQCSRCGLLGVRKGKKFKCPHCGHVDHADVNASFVIGSRRLGLIQSIDQSTVERDIVESKTDNAQEATNGRIRPQNPVVLTTGVSQVIRNLNALARKKNLCYI
jgi:putative transposase